MKGSVCLFAAAALLVAGCATTPHAAPGQAAPGPVQAAAPRSSSTAPAAPGRPLNHPSLISAEAPGIYRTEEEQKAPLSGDELSVIASAKTLLGKAPEAKVTVNGKGFTLDCIGTVGAIFWNMSLDVQKDFDLYTGDGVNRLYMTLRERNAIFTDRLPRPGDVVFWSNTLDANGDGDRVHDPRTHAGIVLAVDTDGTISYVHENLYTGIVIEKMNLLRPATALDERGKKINSGMAIATKPGDPLPVHTLSGDVFDSFGDVLGSRDYFFVDLTQRQAALPGATSTTGGAAVAMANSPESCPPGCAGAGSP
jgi:cell wall-associated NlpC family hydrolase